MKMKVEGKLLYSDTDNAKIEVSVDHECAHGELISNFYLAMLAGMRDAHKDEFYKAMDVFIENELAEMEGKDE